jgi:hypothetical protein
VRKPLLRLDQLAANSQDLVGGQQRVVAEFGDTAAIQLVHLGRQRDAQFGFDGGQRTG